MSFDHENTDATTSGNRPLCPTCGGPSAPHEETLIRLGHGREVRHRYRCLDPWCRGSLPGTGTTTRSDGRTAG
jgi:hypothetical protein